MIVNNSPVRRTCGSTRRYLTKDDVIGEITGPTIRWLSGIKEKNLKGCGKLTLASDLSDIADMTHVDLSNMNSLTGTSSRVAAHVGLQWSLNVVPDQVTFLHFQNLTNLRNWTSPIAKDSPVRRACGSTRRSSVVSKCDV